jgi:glycosyltransferase 2 family protein
MKRARTHRRWLALAFSLALTLGTLYFACRGIDRDNLAWLLSTQHRGLLLTATVLLLLQVIFGSERWRAILSAMSRGRPPSLLSVQAVFYASSFFNNVSLGTVAGDVARVWLARRFDVPLKRLVLSLLLDHALTVGALIVLAVATLPVIAHPFAVTLWSANMAILLSAAAGCLLVKPIERLLARWRNQRLIYLFLRAAEELRHVAPAGILLAFFYALLSAACATLAAYCIARSLDMDVGPIAIIAVMSVVIFVAELPISFAGWGVREVSVVTLLGLLGADRETALLLSVQFGMITTLISLPGALIWLTMHQHEAIATDVT